MSRWGLVVGLLLCGFTVFGCGGTQTQPEAADAEDLSDSETEMAEVSESSTEDEASAEPSAEPASLDDVQAIVQAVIDDETLEPFLHLGEPGRFPLKIAGDMLPGSIEVIKATKPVEIVDASTEGPVIVFREIEVTGNKAWVRFRYDVENLSGSASLEKGASGWQLVNSRQVERTH